MGHGKQDVLMRRYKQRCEVSTASLEHGILSPTPVMERGRGALHDSRRADSVECWLSRVNHATKNNVIIFNIIASRTHKGLGTAMSRCSSCHQERVQSCHRHQRQEGKAIP